MKVDISLKNNSEREKLAKMLLEHILSKYNLEKWIRCREVVIEQDAFGKAFPIIRLSAWKENEEGMMAQFIHEQYHWIEKGNEEQIKKAIEELKIMFPNAPINKPEGGGNEYSTYNHLMICRLEFLALKEILGEESAIRIVASNTNYTWIRKIVLENGNDIDKVVKKYFPNLLDK